MPTARTSGAIEHAPVGVGATEAQRRVLSDADEVAVLDVETASLEEAGRTYADSVPERAASARRAAQALTDLREER